jgi:hypothetical protein
MANRARTQNGNRDEFTIHLSHLEMLKLEKLFKRLEAETEELLTTEENELMLFAPELPSGTYEI